jgi:hypothetical protein
LIHHLTPVNLLTAIVDTDYSHWAVFMQCEEEEVRNRFLSTRILSRLPWFSPEHWQEVKETMQVRLLGQSNICSIS